MKKISLFLLFSVTINIFLMSQEHESEVLMTIGETEVTLGEFERIYMKNNNDNVVQKQSVEEYLDMFINFKLKVLEAEELGMDTATSFLNEFNSYKKQLAKPYMTNPEITKKYSHEAYNRLKKEIYASHIMVRLDENASVEDTLYAYEKLMSIRQRIIDGEDFEKVARATSDDPSAKTNGGLLGWFSAFRMVYNFESIAFNTPAGEISIPFRTQYGMHILKVHDTREALGSRRIAHVFIRAPKSMSIEEAKQAEEKALSLIDSLNQGVDFAGIAMRHSEDRSSAVKGGEIPWISSGQMIPEFDKVVFDLKNPEDISEAILSDYGWHIIKLLEKKLLGTYEEEEAEILSKMKKGDRNSLSDNAFINQIKNEYNYSANSDNYYSLLARIDTTILDASWSLERIAGIEELELFSLGSLKVSVGDFANYLVKKQRKQAQKNVEVFVRQKYDEFEKVEILGYEEDNLPNKYEDYKHILQEYHDGILLFDLTDELVWTKAVKDSSGLESYFSKNKNNYKWEKRAHAYIITVNDSSRVAEVRKYSQKLIKKKKFNTDKLYAEFCPNDTLKACLTITEGKYEKGDNEKIDATNWKSGLGKGYTINGLPSFVVIHGTINPSTKKLEETRGMVTADYQKFLEDKWIEELRGKYEIKVNEELLKHINE